MTLEVQLDPPDRKVLRALKAPKAPPAVRPDLRDLKAVLPALLRQTIQTTFITTAPRGLATARVFTLEAMRGVLVKAQTQSQ